MKKILLIMLAAMATLTAAAETRQYTEKLTVTMSDVPATQEGEVLIETLENGSINLTLKNFVYESANTPVGTIALTNLALSEVAGKYAGQFKKFSATQNITISAGDKDGIETWAGPFLGELAVTATGQISEDKFYAKLALDVTAVYGDILYVEIGTPLNSSYYSDVLTVTINGNCSDPIPATVRVETLEDGNINFILKNFSLDEDMHVGNITVENLELTDGDGYKTFYHEGEIYSTPGDIEGVDVDSYIGPLISPIPIILSGKITEDQLYVTIDIDMRDTLGQIIYVVFGTDIETGIQSVDCQNQTAEEGIYDLSGRRVSRAAKGLYIQNGKKVVR